MSTSQPYNPTVESLIEAARIQRGSAEENIAKLIKYKISTEFDAALWGMDIVRGELIGIQAPDKQRKTTLLANIVLHAASQLREKGYWMAIDTLESGMPPETYTDVLVCILATRLMVGTVLGDMNREHWPKVEEIVNHPELKDQLRLSPKFLRFGLRSKMQQEFIDKAEKVLAILPISIFGPSSRQGTARELKKAMERWDLLYHGKFPGLEGKLHKIFTADHVQQYYGFAGSDYNALESVTSEHSNFVVTHEGAVDILLSQVSVTSRRLAAAGAGEAIAKGGAKLSSEVTVLFETEYDKDVSEDFLLIKTPRGRGETPPVIKQEIDRFSGSFLRPGIPYF